MFTFLLVVHAIIAASLVAVILMQRSEGGGLGMGGSPSGLMSARGAADFLTRATAVLATLFVAMSIGLATLASVSRAPSTIDTSLARPDAKPMAPVGNNPLGAIPGPGLGGAPGVPAPGLALPLPLANAPSAPAPASDGGSSGDKAATGEKVSGKSDKASSSSSSKEKPEASSRTAPEQAGSAKSGTTPIADAKPEKKAAKAPAAASSLDIVPLRQTPKVGTLAPTPPAIAPEPAPVTPGNGAQP